MGGFFFAPGVESVPKYASLNVFLIGRSHPLLPVITPEPRNQSRLKKDDVGLQSVASGLTFRYGTRSAQDHRVSFQTTSFRQLFFKKNVISSSVCAQIRTDRLKVGRTFRLPRCFFHSLPPATQPEAASERPTLANIQETRILFFFFVCFVFFYTTPL